MNLDFSAAEVFLLGLSTTAAFVYGLVFLRRPPSPARSVAKTLPVAALALLAAEMAGPALLALALALSAIGDAALSRPGDRAFLTGLGAFLLAHLAFIPLFAGAAEAPSSGRLLLASGAIALAATVLSRLWPRLGRLRWPVAAYVPALLAMALIALAAPASRWPLAAGALLFLASDAVLTFETFLFAARPRLWTAPFIWASYYAATVLIAAAFLCPRFAG